MYSNENVNSMFSPPPLKNKENCIWHIKIQKKQKVVCHFFSKEIIHNISIIFNYKNPFIWWLASLRLLNLYLNGLKKRFLFSFSTLMDLWQQSALMSRAGLGGGGGDGKKGKVERRLNWAPSQQRAAAPIQYPASFSHTAIFRYWALSAKNK